jgi:hypothetical protein
MSQRTLQFSALLLAFSVAQVWIENQANAQRSEAQRSDESAKADQVEQDHESWYYGSQETPKKSIAQQKAELKAEQRMDRLASQKWYGMSMSRPTASGMPFTTMHYAPTWTRPGGQPFAWYTGYPQPIVYRYGADRWYW